MSDKTVVLGISGAMTSATVYDLSQTSNFDEIVVADADDKDAAYQYNTLSLTGCVVTTRGRFTLVRPTTNDGRETESTLPMATNSVHFWETTSGIALPFGVVFETKV